MSAEMAWEEDDHASSTVQWYAYLDRKVLPLCQRIQGYRPLLVCINNTDI